MFQIFDRVLTSGRTETLLFLTLIAVLAVAVYGALETIRSFMLARVSYWLERRLSRDVIVQSLGDTNNAGLLRDFLRVQGFVGSTSVAPFFDAPWIPIFLIIMWLLHPWLGGLALAAAILLAILILYNETATRERLQGAQRRQGAVMGTLGQAARNADTVRALNMGPAMSERLGAPLDQAQDDLRLAADSSGLALGLIKFVRFSVQISVLGLGAYLVLQSQLTPGGMIAGSIILGRALAPIEQAVSAWRGFVGARASYDRLTEAFGDNDGRAEKMKLPDPIGQIALENVSFAPPGSDTLILKQVSFSLEPGLVLGVVGPSAAGKTTLCRLITGIVSPQSGAVRLDGAEIDHWDPEQRASAVGYLPQDVELFPGTVKDNIARMGLPEDAAVVDAAKLAGAHDMILQLPDGYDTDVEAGGRNLSAGQHQRIGLARAVYGSPKVLVLDEPNSNLDEEGERALLGAILRLTQEGVTVIVAAHRRTILQVVDQLLLLREGATEAFGPRDDVLAAIETARQNAAASGASE